LIELSPQLLLKTGPVLLFAMAVAETAVPLGVMVPAGVALATGALLAHQGYMAWEVVLAASISGALVGDSTGYWLGRQGSRLLQLVPGRMGEGFEGIQVRTAKLFRSHALFAVSGGRLIAFVRTFMPTTAGASGVPYLRFLAFDLPGVMVWAGLYVGLGVVSAEGWRAVHGGMNGVEVGSVVVLLIVLLVLSTWLLFRRARRRLAMIRPPGGARRAMRIGLTGNAASGKSTVAAVWRAAGVPVVDADQLARKAVVPGSPGLERVVERFGSEVLMPDGTLDRGAIGRLVFKDDDARTELEAILHPEIARLREQWLVRHEAEGAVLLVSEIPLLFEVGLFAEFDRVVVVHAPDEERRRRLVEDRGMEPTDAERLMAAQGDPEEKRRRAHHVLQNSDSREALESEARRLLTTLRAAAEAGPGAGKMYLDLHLHTRGSWDSLSDPEAVLQRARERGIERVAITDHNRLDVALEMAERYPDEVIPGEEVRTAEGVDVIGLYLSREIPEGTPALETCRRIREQGGIAYLPHPFARGKGGNGKLAETLAPVLDAVEVFNARVLSAERNRLGAEFARRHDLPGGAGSDAHTIGEVGNVRLEVAVHRNEPDALVQALRRSEVHGVPASPLAFVRSNAAKLLKRVLKK